MALAKGADFGTEIARARASELSGEAFPQGDQIAKVFLFLTSIFQLFKSSSCDLLFVNNRVPSRVAKIEVFDLGFLCYAIQT